MFTNFVFEAFYRKKKASILRFNVCRHRKKRLCLVWHNIQTNNNKIRIRGRERERERERERDQTLSVVHTLKWAKTSKAKRNKSNNDTLSLPLRFRFSLPLLTPFSPRGFTRKFNNNNNKQTLCTNKAALLFLMFHYEFLSLSSHFFLLDSFLTFFTGEENKQKNWNWSSWIFHNFLHFILSFFGHASRTNWDLSITDFCIYSFLFSLSLSLLGPFGNIFFLSLGSACWWLFFAGGFI